MSHGNDDDVEVESTRLRFLTRSTLKWAQVHVAPRWQQGKKREMGDMAIAGCAISRSTVDARPSHSASATRSAHLEIRAHRDVRPTCLLLTASACSRGKEGDPAPGAGRRSSGGERV